MQAKRVQTGLVAAILLASMASALSVAFAGTEADSGRTDLSPSQRAEYDLLMKRKAVLEEALNKEVSQERADLYRANLEDIDRKLEALEYRDGRADKNQRDWERAKAEIEVIQAERNRLAATIPGKSYEEATAIRAQIKELGDRVESLKNKMKRKERRYRRHTGGDEIPGSKPSPSPAASASPSPSPSSSPVDDKRVPLGPSKKVTDDRKKPECWVIDSKPLDRKVFAYFPIGVSELRDNAAEEEENSLRQLFEKNVTAVLDELNKPGSEYRVGRIQATGYASTIPMKGKTLQQLSSERGQFAASKFFATTSASHFLMNMKTPDYERTTTSVETYEPVVGPPYGGYPELKKLKATVVTDAMLLSAAKKIMKSGDFTPAKGDTVEETMENLRACCSKNAATLKYQPYQFMQLDVFASKYSPSAQSCVQASTNVTDINYKPADSAPTTGTITPSNTSGGGGGSGLESQGGY